MKYFRCNYHKLEHLKQVNYWIFINVIFVISILFIIIAACTPMSLKINCYGIYKDNILTIKINSKLSDKLKNVQYITFKNQKIQYYIDAFKEYEFIGDDIYQVVNLAIDGKFLDNEVGKVTIHYDKKTILRYILDLFK